MQFLLENGADMNAINQVFFFLFLFSSLSILFTCFLFFSLFPLFLFKIFTNTSHIRKDGMPSSLPVIVDTQILCNFSFKRICHSMRFFFAALSSALPPSPSPLPSPSPSLNFSFKIIFHSKLFFFFSPLPSLLLFC